VRGQVEQVIAEEPVTKRTKVDTQLKKEKKNDKDLFGYVLWLLVWLYIVRYVLCSYVVIL